VVLSSFYEGKKTVLERILHLGRLIVDLWKWLVHLGSHNEMCIQTCHEGQSCFVMSCLFLAILYTHLLILAILSARLLILDHLYGE
jgi:hypothetical protein